MNRKPSWEFFRARHALGGRVGFLCGEQKTTLGWDMQWMFCCLLIYQSSSQRRKARQSRETAQDSTKRGKRVEVALRLLLRNAVKRKSRHVSTAVERTFTGAGEFSRKCAKLSWAPEIAVSAVMIKETKTENRLLCWCRVLRALGSQSDGR